MKHLTPAELSACKAIAMTAQDRARPVIMAILKSAKVTEAEFASDIRTERIAHTRQIIMAALHDRGFSTTQIGALLGRDHTTVIHGIRAAYDRAPMVFKSRRNGKGSPE